MGSRYVNWEDLVTRYPGVEKFAGAQATNSFWIPYAEHEVDGRLGGKFTVPFTTMSTAPGTPMMVKDLVIDLAYYRMGLTRIKNAGDLKQSIDARISDLVSGKAVLMTNSLEQIARTGDRIYSNTEDYHTAFGADDPVNWRVSSQQMVDEQNARGVF